jgi:hypothetical protein
MFIRGLFFLCGKRVRLHFFEAQEHIIEGVLNEPLYRWLILQRFWDRKIL